MGKKLILVLVILCVVKHQSDATATMSIHLHKFVNTGDKLSDGAFCDSATNKGDPSFVLCLDSVYGNSEPYSCRYALLRTNTVVVDIGERLTFPASLPQLSGGTIPNPFNVPFTAWPGTVQLKVRILDNDGNHSPSGHIDDMFDFIELMPSASENEAAWQDRTLSGSRPLFLDPTSLEYSVMLYCDDGFYGPYCDQVYGQSACN